MKNNVCATSICFITALAILAAMSFFTVCGISKGPPALIWWMTGAATPGFIEDLKIISDYTEEKIGVRLDIRLAEPGKSARFFDGIIRTGKLFDIMFVNGSTYSRFAAIGAFADLTDMLGEETPQLWSYIPGPLWEGVKIKGRIYAVPTYKDSSATGYYFWDREYTQKYDINLNRSDPAYLDDVFRQMKNDEGGLFYPLTLSPGGGSFIFAGYDGLLPGLEPVGVRHDDPQRRVVNTLEQPGIAEILRYIHTHGTGTALSAQKRTWRARRRKAGRL